MWEGNQGRVESDGQNSCTETRTKMRERGGKNKVGEILSKYEFRVTNADQINQCCSEKTERGCAWKSTTGRGFLFVLRPPISE